MALFKKKTPSPEPSAAQIAQLEEQLSREGRKIQEAYARLGKRYASLHREDYAPEYADDMKTLFQSESQVVEYWKQLQDLKGIQLCQRCGRELSRTALSCPLCGELTQTGREMEAGKPTLCGFCGNIVPKDMHFCSHCGTPVSPEKSQTACPQCILDAQRGLKFCTSCGKALASPAPSRICPECGNPLSEKALFCNNCGTKL